MPRKSLTTTFAVTADTSTNFDPLDWSGSKNLLFRLELTAAGTGAGDLLDVYIESSSDGQITWDQRARFERFLGTATVSALAPEVREVTITQGPVLGGTEEMLEPTGSAGASGLLASTLQNRPFPSKNGPNATWRARFDVTSATSPTFSGNLRVTYDSAPMAG